MIVCGTADVIQEKQYLLSTFYTLATAICMRFAKLGRLVWQTQSSWLSYSTVTAQIPQSQTNDGEITCKQPVPKS